MSQVFRLHGSIDLVEIPKTVDFVPMEQVYKCDFKEKCFENLKFYMKMFAWTFIQTRSSLKFYKLSCRYNYIDLMNLPYDFFQAEIFVSRSCFLFQKKYMLIVKNRNTKTI